MDTNFIQKLRMANLFPAGATGGQTYGMPDMNSGNMDMREMDRTMNLMRQHRNLMAMDDDARAVGKQQIANYQGKGPISTRVAQIGQSMQQQNQPQIRVIDNQPTPYQQAQIQLDRDKLNLDRELGMRRTDVSQQNANTSSMRAQIARKLADGTATDEEKNWMEKELIRERGAVESGLIYQRGGIENQQIDMRNQNDINLQNIRGSQALEQIGARGQVDSRLQDDRQQFDQQNPLRVGNAQANAIRELQMTRPDIAKYLIQGADGNLAISEDAPMMIQNEIYNKVFRPSLQAQPVNKPITQPNQTPAKPTAAELILKYGGKQ